MSRLARLARRTDPLDAVNFVNFTGAAAASPFWCELDVTFRWRDRERAPGRAFRRAAAGAEK